MLLLIWKMQTTHIVLEIKNLFVSLRLLRVRKCINNLSFYRASLLSGVLVATC